MNAYDLVEDVRDLLGEATATHWSDRLILRAINRAQRRIYMKMAMTMGDWFVKQSTSLTPVAGVIYPPSDCSKPIFIEEVSSGREVKLALTIRDKARTQVELGGYHYEPTAYLTMNSIIVNNSSYTTPVYLWYERNCPDLHTGTAASGSAGTSLILEDSLGHSITDDYYNNLGIHIISGTGAGTDTTISDYDGGTRALTLASGSVSTDSVYALVSILPDEAYDYLCAQATMSCLAKPAGVVDENYIRILRSDLKEAKTAFMDWMQLRIKNNRYISLAEGM